MLEDEDEPSRPRSLRPLAAAVVALLLIAVVAVVATDSTPGDVERARAEAADGNNFASAEDAANTLLTVGALLRREAEACATEHDERNATCRAFFAGSAHAKAGSIGLLRCTRPDLFDAREAMRAYLDDLADDPATATLPDLPYCR